MCGRFTLRTPLTVLSQQFLFDLSELPADLTFAPRYNIAPTQTVAVVRQPAAGRPRRLALLHWGLVPSWSKDLKRAAGMINARAETVAEKPAFRAALTRRRCLVLADGFYEWKKAGKAKQAFCFRLRDERPFAFAGLWEYWRGTAGSAGPPLESCTIVTTTANEVCAPIHERMPVILAAADYGLWLDPSVNDLQRLVALLQPYRAEDMKGDPVDVPSASSEKSLDPPP
jgi:putative SOS response-associated peptidase YedK